MNFLRLAATLLFAVSFTVSADEIYICKCDTGAHGSCSAGSDANAGTSTASPKLNIPADFTIDAAPAGRHYNLCSGGYWNAESGRVISNTNATRADPLIFRSYAPPSGATGQPVWKITTNTSVIVFGDFNNTVQDAGYLLQDIYFSGPGSGGSGAFATNGLISYVTFDSVRIENFFMGLFIVSGAGTDAQFITLKNSVVSNNFGFGILGTATDFLIENNTFENNNGITGEGTQHAIYLGGLEQKYRVTVRGNLFLNNSAPSGGACNGGNLTVHGLLDQLVIENNRIEVESSTGTCYGVSLQAGYDEPEIVTRTVVRGNTIVNVRGNGILAKLGPRVVIENNKCIDTANAANSQCISVESPQDAPDAPANAFAARVINNTCYMTAPTTGYCVKVDAGTQHIVANNISYVGASSGAHCWSHSALSNFTAWNNNQCYELGSGQWSATYSTLAAAQAAGFDTSGSNADPLFAATPSTPTWDLSLQSESSARSTGSTTYKSRFDISGCLRAATPDKGAYEYGGTPCLTVTAPPGLR